MAIRQDLTGPGQQRFHGQGLSCDMERPICNFAEAPRQRRGNMGQQMDHSLSSKTRFLIFSKSLVLLKVEKLMSITSLWPSLNP